MSTLPPSRQAASSQNLRPRQFSSDNRSGLCPEALAALQSANAHHAPSYGDDPYTHQAASLLRETFQSDCEVFFTATGTAANSLALASLCQPFNSIICHEASHINTDECAAPEFFTGGAKLLAANDPLGKITPESLHALIAKRTDVHFSKARALSLSQSTEFGTVYTPREIHALTTIAHAGNLRVHMDGARFANAVAALNCSPAELSWKAGIDVLSFGGTKNGMFCAEALLFFNRDLAADFAHRRKQAGQLLSKMRFVTAQWAAVLPGNAWLKHAAHANAMAQKLAVAIQNIPGIHSLFPVQANALFLHAPPALQSALRARGWEFYTFIADTGIRLMCSWDTTQQDIESFAADLKTLAAQS